MKREEGRMQNKKEVPSFYFFFLEETKKECLDDREF